ncbi:MAG: hypothetical protein AB1591_10580 [Pseudomonadota bacterium]
MSRLDDLVRFYDLLGRLELKLGGPKWLAECHGRMGWPGRGVYFFFENGEERSTTGQGPRVVRVGTHALSTGSKSTLWGRLSQHRGQAGGGGGNHRGSIFRLLVGSSLRSMRKSAEPSSWGVGSDPGQAAKRLGFSRDWVKAQESALEEEVSGLIGKMPFLWLPVDDPPGPDSLRGRIERNAIALLSNYKRPAIDPPSPHWLGLHSDREKVRLSGLWNNNHVEETYDPGFLEDLEFLIDE